MYIKKTVIIRKLNNNIHPFQDIFFVVHATNSDRMVTPHFINETNCQIFIARV